MSTYGDAAKLSDDLAEDLLKNKSVEDFASGVASTLAKHAVSMATGSTHLGEAAGGVTSGLSRSHKNATAKVVTTVATDLALAVGSIVVIPIAIAGSILKKIFK